MDVNEALAPATSGAMDKAAEPYSASWWQSLSADELRVVINGGFGSAGFVGASVEAERRARERRKAEHEAAQAEAARNKRLRLLILEGMLLATLLALIATELIR
jgi:hypothetical protein